MLYDASARSLKKFSIDILLGLHIHSFWAPLESVIMDSQSTTFMAPWLGDMGSPDGMGDIACSDFVLLSGDPGNDGGT